MEAVTTLSLKPENTPPLSPKEGPSKTGLDSKVPTEIFADTRSDMKDMLEHGAEGKAAEFLGILETIPDASLNPSITDRKEYADVIAACGWEAPDRSDGGLSATDPRSNQLTDPKGRYEMWQIKLPWLLYMAKHKHDLTRAVTAQLHLLSGDLLDLTIQAMETSGGHDNLSAFKHEKKRREDNNIVANPASKIQSLDVNPNQPKENGYYPPDSDDSRIFPY